MGTNARSSTTVAAPIACAYMPTMVVLSMNVYPSPGDTEPTMGTSPGVMMTT